MKRVGVPRLAAAADEASSITATTIQQQSGGTSMHTLTQQSQQPIIAAMLAVGGQQNASGISSQFVRAPSRPQQQQVGVGGGGPAVINYSKAGGVQYAAQPKQQPQPPVMPRHKQLVGNQSPGGGGVQVSISSGGGTGGPQFQRLKVEDALSYLDQVKYKFNNQPQVYNDFLDIMKEFKSQSIDTPGVITRVSNLFKGHPELIVGFNTFLPPGYKIEVQANGQGIAYQVSVSMPSPTGLGGAQHGLVGTGASTPVALLQTHSVPQQQQQQQQQLVHIVPVPSSVSGGGMVHNLSVGPVAAASNTLHHISQAHQQIEAAAAAAASHHGPGMGCSAQVGHAAPTAPPPPPGGQPVEFNHAIEYVNKIKSRFSRQPDKYKRFLEILHAYQRGQRDLKEPLVKQQTEQEVYAQVAKLFENQDDLLAEFGQFLPDASGKGNGATLTAPGARVASPPAPPIAPPAQALSIAPKYSQERQQERLQVAAGALVGHHHQRSSLDGVPGSGNVVQGDQSNASETYSSNLYRTPPLSPPPATHHHQQQISTHHTLPKLGSAAPIQQQQQQHHHLKRSPSFTSATNQLTGGVVGPPPAKKARPVCTSAVLLRDVSYAEAAKYGTLADFGFFDKVRKALRSQEVYDNFLRCLLLFTNEVISKSELLTVTAPFLSRHQELQRWLQELLGPPASPPPAASTVGGGTTTGVGRSLERTSGGGETGAGWGAPGAAVGGGGALAGGGALGGNSLGYGTAPYASTLTYGGGERYTGESRGLRFESLGALGAQLRHDRPQGDAAMDVDLSTCKRLGTSYCALPCGGQDAAARRCSGRTPLCRDVLNDTWVSFPTWSEDSTFVTSRKTQYEEYMYRCEDERFELDVVIETNASTIRVLEGVHKKLSRMGAEEAARFRLDDCLGGSSATIHQRALRRIYGDKATDIIAGLKKNPVVAVPVVLRRLKAKEEEWREAQKGFNKQWREQNEKYYLKSLDHQGINFKQNDLKALRSKSLFNDIETAYEERRGSSRPGPDLSVAYGAACGPDVLRDAAELLIHHVRRQTAIQKAEKRRIKQLLRQFVPDLFGHPRQPLSDDERDDDDKEGDLCGGGSSSPGSPGGDDMPVGNQQVKQEKNDVSSESDTNHSDRGGGRTSTRSHHDNHKNNNNNAGIGDASHVKDSSLRRSSGGADGSIKTEPMGDPSTLDDSDTKDIKDHIVAEGGARTFVCTTSWYLFLRLHGVLCARLAGARCAAVAAAAQEERDARLRRPSTAVALKLKPSNVVSAGEYYATLLELVRGVLDGNVEACALEDAAREMLGIRAYPVYTLDKVVSSAVRQLQHCVSERASVRCAELASRGGDPASYRRRAHRQLRDQQAVFLVQVYGGEECRVTFELVEGRDGGRSVSPPAANMTPSHQSRGSSGMSRLAEWSRYNDGYACPTTPTDSASNTPAHRPSYYEGLSWCGRRALFLRRNRVAVAGAARFANGARTPPSPAARAAAPAGHARRKPPAPRPAARPADGGPRCDKCGTVCGGSAHNVTPCRLMHAYKADYFEFKRCRRGAQKGGAATRQMQAKVTSAMCARWRRWLRAWAEQHVPPNARDKLLIPGVNNSVCGVSSSHSAAECATDR